MTEAVAMKRARRRVLKPVRSAVNYRGRRAGGAACHVRERPLWADINLVLFRSLASR